MAENGVCGTNPVSPRRRPRLWNPAPDDAGLTTHAGGRMRKVVRRDERGSVTEMVLLAPGLVLLLVMVIQVVLWAHAGQVAKAAARQGSRAARLAGGGAELGTMTGEQFLIQAGHGGLVSAHVEASIVGDVATVAVTGRAPQLLPFFAPVVKASASGHVEHFEATP